jgi:hypothetical protein
MTDFPKMNPEYKAKWVLALRSGEYQQGHSSLRRHDDTFCCLGVLCEVVRREHPDIGVWAPGPVDGLVSFLTPKEVEATRLPNSILSLVDLVDSVGNFAPERNPVQVLISLNDHAPRKSFTEIANWIEANL